MSRPIQREIQLGDNNPPLVWGFGPVEAPQIPLGAQFSLDIDWLQPSKTTLKFESPADLTIDYVRGTVAWNYSIADTQSMPLTNRIGYTLRCVHEGTVTTFAYGPLVIKTGIPL